MCEIAIIILCVPLPYIMVILLRVNYYSPLPRPLVSEFQVHITARNYIVYIMHNYDRSDVRLQTTFTCNQTY